jgi:hypothetical protein
MRTPFIKGKCISLPGTAACHACQNSASNLGIQLVDQLHYKQAASDNEAASSQPSTESGGIMVE